MSATILVVEDDREINELVSEYLALENIKPLQANNGTDGIRLAQEAHPDAMVLDLMMPDIHGFEVAKLLTSRRATYDIPIVVLSCMCQDCDRREGFQAGALFFMNKPFLPDDLLMKLRQALDWKQQLKTRPPIGTIVLGGKDTCGAARGLNEMVADIFTRTTLSDEAVAQIRGAVESMAKWATDWNHEHESQIQVRLEYRVNPVGSNGDAAAANLIEWKLSESAGGMVTEAFFKPASTVHSGGLIGWGASALMAKTAPVAVPTEWMQLLEKFGATRFEKDAKTSAVRFARTVGAADGVNLQPK